MCKYFWKGEKDEIYAAEKSIRGHLNYHAYLLKSLIQKHKKDRKQFKFILIGESMILHLKKHSLLKNILVMRGCVMYYVSCQCTQVWERDKKTHSLYNTRGQKKGE